MNKKVQKVFGGALSATMAAGVVGAIPAGAATMTVDQLYAAAYNATATALKTGTQADINAARTAIDALTPEVLKAVPDAKGYFSHQVDTVQQPILVKIVDAINLATATPTQANVNAAKAAIPADLLAVWKNSYSSAIDTVAQGVINKAVAAVTKAKTGTDADVTAAKAAVADLATSTDANVAAFAGTLKTQVDAIVVSVTVSGVSVSDAKTLKVTFGSAVADTTKVTFDVKRGASATIAVTGLTVTWSADKTSATLASEANLPADTYKVTATGASTTGNVGTAVVSAQTVAKLVIVSSDLVKNSATPATAATFTYKVLDQYGTDMTSTTSSSDISATYVVASSSGLLSLTPSTGVATLSHTFTDAEAAKTAVVTLVHKATGVVATTTLNVVSAASVQTLTFGTTSTFPSGITRIQIGQTAAVDIPVTAKDQYGNAITDAATLNSALNIVTSNTGAAASFTADANGNAQLELNTAYGAGMTDKATVVVTFVNKTTGMAWSKSFDVQKAPVATKIVVGDFASTTIANGDSGIVLNADVYDQFGNKLAPADIVSNKAVIDGWIASATDLGTITVNKDPNSSNYGKLVTGTVVKTGVPTDNETLVLVFNAPDGVVTKNVTISPAREVTTVAKIDSTTLLQGANEDLKFVLKDQYDAVVSNDDVTAGKYLNPDLTYDVEVTKVSGDDSGVVVTLPNKSATAGTTFTGASEKDMSVIHVVGAAGKTGSYKITVSLLSGGVATTTASTIVNVAKNNVAGLTYSVSDVATLNGSTSMTGSAISANPYAKQVVVNAKDAAGSSYVINAADIVSVTSDNANVVAGADSGNWYVAAKPSGIADATDTATLTISVNTLDGIKTFTKSVTASQAAPVIKTLRVVDATVAAAGTTDASGVNDKLTYNFGTIASAKTGTAINVIGLDQYGVWSNVAPTLVVVNSTDLAPVDAFSVATGTYKLGATKTATVGSDIKVTFIKDAGSIQVTTNIAGN